MVAWWDLLALQRWRGQMAGGGGQVSKCTNNTGSEYNTNQDSSGMVFQTNFCPLWIVEMMSVFPKPS